MSKNPSSPGSLSNSCLMYKRGFEGIQLAYQSIFCLSNRQIKDQSEAIRKVYPNPMNKEIGTSHTTLQRFESKTHLYNSYHTIFEDTVTISI